MKYLSDLHTHTIVSGHAYTTLLENINYCAEHGIKILGTSEHAPSMPGAPHEWYFGNLKVVPRQINGVTILKGCEANILDVDGNIDLDEFASKYLDYLILSHHEPVFKPMSLEENTNSILNAISKNKKIEIIGHLGNPLYEIDYEAIVKKCFEENIMIEINNSSLSGNSRVGSDKKCIRVAELCKIYNTKIILSSDAHMCNYIGGFDDALKLLNSIDFPEELIMNPTERLIPHLKSKGRLKDLD